MLITCSVQAEIFKSQNDKGEWVYTDIPSPDAERIKLPPLSTYSPPPIKSSHSAATPAEESAAIYQTMVFIEPQDDVTIRDNEGKLKVMVGLDPALKIEEGHKIQYYLDGSPYGDAIASSQVTVKKVDRGEHRLGAQVLGAGGELLLKAEPVTFHLHRQSVNQPNRATPPPPPKAN